jgi:hypothetical protein
MTHRKDLIVTLFMVLNLLYGVGYGQRGKVSDAAKDKNPKYLTEFGFTQLFGGVIVVRATLDMLPDSLNFILDTGSGGISLDSVTAAFLGVETVPSGRTIRGIAGVKEVQFAYNHRLNLPGLSIDSLDFHINDYEMLSGVYGIRVDGIIGYSFFRRYILGVDFDKKLIKVYPPGNFTYPKGGHVIRPAIAALPMQFAEVTDNTSVSGRFYIDTGAGLCLLLNDKYASDSAIFAPGKTIYKSVAEGIGGKKEMRVTVVRKFKLGPYKFRKMPTYIFDDEFNVTSYPFLGGLIGNDLLRRFNMVINYGKSEFHLLPNKSYQEAFDYAYTGFNMFQDGYDVIVTDVIIDSPADKAGLKDGDIIVSIGNKFASNLQGYKDILQQPGNKIIMVIARESKLVEVKLVIGSIKKQNNKMGIRYDNL